MVLTLILEDADNVDVVVVGVLSVETSFMKTISSSFSQFLDDVFFEQVAFCYFKLSIFPCLCKAFSVCSCNIVLLFIFIAGSKVTAFFFMSQLLAYFASLFIHPKRWQFLFYFMVLCNDNVAF